MEVLNPIAAAIALLGIHTLKPYHSLLMNSDTNYSTLLNAFPQLYEELSSTIHGSQLLKTDQLFSFVSNETLKNSLPGDDLLQTIPDCCETYPQEIEKLISLCLQKFAAGFAHQKGAIFGFSNKSNGDTGTILKISELNEKDLQQLNNVPVHNIGEERSVGLFNNKFLGEGGKILTQLQEK